MSRRITTMLVLIMMIMGLVGCGKGGSLTASRNVSVTDINGTAEVTSSGKSKDAFKGQQLVSGDSVDVHSDSDMTLLLDEDKHVFASENSHFSLEATGQTGATKTKIVVDNGTTLIGIDNKLGEEETFEVSTPNATMAVRGTVFYVTVTNTEDGTKTELVVKEGVVEAITVENGEVRKDIVSEGQTSAYFGTAPTDEQISSVSEAEAATYDTISSDKIPQDRDGSKGLVGVYRSGNAMVVIAQGVPFAYNRSDGIVIDNADHRSYCMATAVGIGEPFFAREMIKVSETEINDFTYRDDINIHVVDMDYYLDGDTLYYRYRNNEDSIEECIVLKRTNENPVDLYMSLIGEGQTEAAKNRENDLDIDQYFADMGVEGVAVTGKAYYFDEYYKDDPTYLKLKNEMKMWSSADILVLSSPVTIDGQSISVCVIGGCNVLYDNMQQRAFEAGESSFYGYFEPYKPGNSDADADITEQVVGSPLYIFYVAEIR